MGKQHFKLWIGILGLVFLSGCASQYFHPIKNGVEFTDDVDYCERKADITGYDATGASRTKRIDSCLANLGWKNQENFCYGGSSKRMPASEKCNF